MAEKTYNDVLREDLVRTAQDTGLPWEKLSGKTILVTGATGLVGSLLIRCLCCRNRLFHDGIRVIAVCRDTEKAKRMLADESRDGLELLTADVCEGFDPGCPVDYVVHAASTTASRDMVERPVETIKTTLLGTIHALELAKKNGAALVYLSSMEVYGHQARGARLTEEMTGSFSPADLRNSYPLGKLEAEALCHAYAAEYGVRANNLRLAQVFGAGIPETDRRAFAEFSRCAASGRDIVLKTAGESERCYLYTTDAVRAVLTVLLSDSIGRTYNAANEDTYASIAEMAERIAAEGGVRCRFERNDDSAKVYPPPSYWMLDTTPLQGLGWKPEIDALQMIERLLRSTEKGQDNSF